MVVASIESLSGLPLVHDYAPLEERTQVVTLCSARPHAGVWLH